MLVVTTDDTDSDYSPCWEFECPECNRVNYFYTISKDECVGCRAVFRFTPSDLVKKLEIRVKYHIAGDNHDSDK